MINQYKEAFYEVATPNFLNGKPEIEGNSF